MYKSELSKQKIAQFRFKNLNEKVLELIVIYLQSLIIEFQ